MNPARDREREIEELRERATALREACLRINEDLDFTAVLRGVLESARSLTDARHGIIILLEDGERVREYLDSGLPPDQAQRIYGEPENELLREHFGFIEEPVRLQDIESYVQKLGLSVFRPAMPVSPAMTLLAAPVRHRGERVGTLVLLEKEGGTAFTSEDEEALVMFASQAALAITNARRYRDAQQASAELEALIKNSPIGVLVFNARTGELVSSNRESARLLHVLSIPNGPLEAIVRVVKVRRADGRQLSSEELSVSKVLGSPETLRSEEIVIEGPDGDRVTALLNVTPMRSDDGDVASLILTVQDMTHLEELERQRSDFLAIVSHELRAPLAAIKGSAATVLGDSLALGRSEMLQFFRIINQHADQMSGLVNDLLDVARIRTGTLHVNCEPTSVIGLVDRARSMFIGVGGRNNIQIELEAELPPVSADGRRVSQVMVNLLSNADRHSPDNSPLRITASQDGAHVTFRVEDKGCGISAERLPHIFRNITPYDGKEELGNDEKSGWGLSICKGIVEAHGGRIRVESDGVGKGTSVTFTIPIAENAGDITDGFSESDAKVERPRRHGRAPILVVDDDPQTLRNVREALTKVGFVPVTTGDPDEVPGLLEQHRPQLVLLDLVLPGTDGIEMMRTLFKNSDIPIVFLSAYAHEEAIDQALEAGAADYVVKPFSPTELVSRIRVALRKASLTVQQARRAPFVLDELTIDYARRRVTMGERDVSLSQIEYRLLVELSEHAGGVLTHEHLLQTVWRRSVPGDTRPLRSAIKSLRRKLGDEAGNPTYIFNQPRVGYRLGANI